MAIEITGRHISASEEIKSYTRDRCEALEEEFPRIEYIHVILDEQKRSKLAEIVVQAKNHVRIEAEESAEHFRAAIDTAFDKAERQLRRQRDKIQDHKSKVSLSEVDRNQADV